MKRGSATRTDPFVTFRSTRMSCGAKIDFFTRAVSLVMSRTLEGGALDVIGVLIECVQGAHWLGRSCGARRAGRRGGSTLCLPKSPILLPQLMLRLTVDTLLGDGLCAPLAAPDPTVGAATPAPRAEAPRANAPILVTSAGAIGARTSSLRTVFIVSCNINCCRNERAL
jgi:hypothetical protein